MTFLYFARVPFVLLFLLFVLALVVFNWKAERARLLAAKEERNSLALGRRA